MVIVSHNNQEAPIPADLLLKIPAALLPYVEVGYIQSKWVVEQLTSQAASYGLQTSVLRIGQLTGTMHSKGTWTPTQWFPALVKSADLVKCLPSGNDVSSSVYSGIYC